MSKERKQNKWLVPGVLTGTALTACCACLAGTVYGQQALESLQGLTYNQLLDLLNFINPNSELTPTPISACSATSIPTVTADCVSATLTETEMPTATSTIPSTLVPLYPTMTATIVPPTSTNIPENPTNPPAPTNPPVPSSPVPTATIPPTITPQPPEPTATPIGG